MHIVITGGSGFLGKKLAQALLQRGALMIGGEIRPVERITLFDVVAPEGLAEDRRLAWSTGDISDAAQVGALIGPQVDAVFHLAAIVSANAEQDFDLGMAVNLDGTRHVLEACRALRVCPRLVFASSCAVYGGDMPDPLTDQSILNPQTSYGMQKAIGELLVHDYSRKGFVDGRALRLPTIVVRPGKPNKAASTFASSIIREPLAGQEAVCPVRPDDRMFLLSPRRVIDALIHAMELPGSAFGYARMLALPGISATIGQMVDALREVAGERVASRVIWQEDPVIQKIVAGWPPDVDAQRARALGFHADESLPAMIRAHIEDELGGKIM